MGNKINLGHGSGGRLTEDLIRNVFLKNFSNKTLDELNDSARLRNPKDYVFTADSFVVNPLFFSGGDIGKLAVYGTVNDLAVMKAKPLYISLNFIIEEGFDILLLEKIAKSIRNAARESGIEIVAGDTKVVEKGKCDGLYISSSGIGKVINNCKYRNPKKGDLILLSGTIGDHAAAVISARDEFNFTSNIKSDCCSLADPIFLMTKISKDIPFIRDVTRGGLSMVLNELADKYNIKIIIDENKIPIKREVNSFCELLGFDPLDLANEGKFLAVIPKEKSSQIIASLRRNKKTKNALVIGEVLGRGNSVILKTKIGGQRIIDKPQGELLPRIC